MADSTVITYQRNLLNVTVANVPATFASIAPTTTKPTSGVLVDHRSSTGNCSPSLIRAIPYSAVTGTTGMAMRFIGWSIRVDSSTGNETYVPHVLAVMNLVFTQPGGTVPTWSIDGATQRPFNGVSPLSGYPAVNVFSPSNMDSTNPEPAAVVVDTTGCQLVTVQFTSSGTPTMGVLYTTL